MSKSFPKSPEVRGPGGFTLIELMLAMALTLILLGIAFTLFDKLNNAADLAGTMADVNENLRAGMNMVARDVSAAGADVPQQGIPLPSGGTTCTPIQLPLPSTTLNSQKTPVFTLPVQYFNPSCVGNLNVVTPGAGFGPTTGSGGTSIPTDSITLLQVNPNSQLGQFQLSSITPVTTANKGCCFPTTTPANSVTITVNAATNGGNPINGPSTANPSWVQVVPGQLIMLNNTYGSVLLAVSQVTCPSPYTAGTSQCSIIFTSGDTTNDPLPFNQFPLTSSSPTAGTIGNLQTLQTSGNVYPATYAYQVTMTTYYLDNQTRPGYWMLMKQLGTGAPAPVTGTVGIQQYPPQPVAMGINVLQFAFSCDVATNCSSASPALDPTRTPTNPSHIRMVNLWLTAIASHPNRKTGTYFTNSIGTTVTDQNLAYYNQYSTGSSVAPP